jgi:hypothetical protein
MPIEGDVIQNALCHRKWIPLELFSVNFDHTKSKLFIGWFSWRRDNE